MKHSDLSLKFILEEVLSQTVNKHKVYVNMFSDSTWQNEKAKKIRKLGLKKSRGKD